MFAINKGQLFIIHTRQRMNFILYFSPKYEIQHTMTNNQHYHIESNRNVGLWIIQFETLKLHFELHNLKSQNYVIRKSKFYFKLYNLQYTFQIWIILYGNL